MLTQRAMNKIIDDMNVQFDAIGTKLPGRSKSNNEQFAWEYYVASYLQRRAAARREAAKEVAQSSGVIFDTEDETKRRPPGTNEVVYTGDYTSVLLTVSKPRILLDQKKLVASLIKQGVNKSVIAKALEEASNEAKAGHQFTASPVTKEAVQASE